MAPAIQATRVGPWGGSGGEPFDDTHIIEVFGPINQIVVGEVSRNLSSKRIASVGLCYQNGNFLTHGNTGDSLTTINLDDDEYVSKVSGRAGENLDQITFFTSKERIFGPFGGSGGTPFSKAFAPPESLLYIFGSAYNRIDRIGLGYGPQPPALESPVTRSEAKGGVGGTAFDHLPTGVLVGKITSIKVRAANRVDKITVQYQGAGGSVSQGGSGGIEKVFDLEDNEYITEVLGRSGSRLDQIEFVLNTGRRSQPFGGSGGSPFSLKMDSAVVKAFHGRAGRQLDKIGVFFENATPLRFEITSMKYDMDGYKSLGSQHMNGASTILDNSKGTREQTLSDQVTVTYSNSTTTSIEESHNVSVSVSYEDSSTAPSTDTTVVRNSDILWERPVGYKNGYTEMTETLNVEELSEAFTFSAKVGAGKKTRAKCLVKRTSFSCPWTAVARVTYQNYPHPATKTIHGTVKGLKAYRMVATYEDIE